MRPHPDSTVRWGISRMPAISLQWPFCSLPSSVLHNFHLRIFFLLLEGFFPQPTVSACVGRRALHFVALPYEAPWVFRNASWISSILIFTTHFSTLQHTATPCKAIQVAWFQFRHSQLDCNSLRRVRLLPQFPNMYLSESAFVTSSIPWLYSTCTHKIFTKALLSIIFPLEGRLWNLNGSRENTQTIPFQERDSVVRVHTSLIWWTLTIYKLKICLINWVWDHIGHICDLEHPLTLVHLQPHDFQKSSALNSLKILWRS